MNYTILLRLTTARPRCSISVSFSMRRRVNLQNTGAISTTIRPSMTIMLSTAATTSMTKDARRATMYQTYRKTIISFVSKDALCSRKLCGRIQTLTVRGNVPARAGGGVTNNGGTNTVRQDRANIGVTTMSLPYQCVRSPTYMKG